DDFPSAYQQIKRTGGKCEQGSEREKEQQQIETQKSTVAMQVGGRELSDESRKNHRHAEERQRKPVRHQDKREVVFADGKPIAEFDDDGTGANVPDDRRKRENGRRKHDSGYAGYDTFFGNPAQQPEQGYNGEHHAGRQDNEEQESLRQVQCL